mmetsp:Transcript_3801/g.6658  ORF Transcript_3801/g.6658 Transcript_3801/m.6658 type:complete len:206 (+) Transcript_3801:382-999(+)
MQWSCFKRYLQWVFRSYFVSKRIHIVHFVSIIIVICVSIRFISFFIFLSFFAFLSFFIFLSFVILRSSIFPILESRLLLNRPVVLLPSKGTSSAQDPLFGSKLSIPDPLACPYDVVGRSFARHRRSEEFGSNIGLSIGFNVKSNVRSNVMIVIVPLAVLLALFLPFLLFLNDNRFFLLLLLLGSLLLRREQVLEFIQILNVEATF